MDVCANSYLDKPWQSWWSNVSPLTHSSNSNFLKKKKEKKRKVTRNQQENVEKAYVRTRKAASLTVCRSENQRVVVSVFNGIFTLTARRVRVVRRVAQQFPGSIIDAYNRDRSTCNRNCCTYDRSSIGSLLSEASGLRANAKQLRNSRRAIVRHKLIDARTWLVV